MLVGGSLAYLALERLNYGMGLFLVGWGAAWAIGEVLIGKMLIGKTDMKAIALGVVSGLIFPWVGVALCALVTIARP